MNSENTKIFIGQLAHQTSAEYGVAIAIGLLRARKNKYLKLAIVSYSDLLQAHPHGFLAASPFLFKWVHVNLNVQCFDLYLGGYGFGISLAI